jgi:4-hydroxy-2-oxoheptanedioate aldolase
MVGPRDLALNMGWADGPQHHEVQAVIDDVIRICNDRGVAAGLTASTGQAAQSQVKRGARLILHSIPDLFFNSARQYLQQARAE